MKKFIRAFMFSLAFMAYTAPLWAQEVVAVADSGNWQDKLMAGLVAALIAFFTAIAGFLGKSTMSYVNRKIKDLDHDLYQKAAYGFVRWVVDYGERLTGLERYEQAMGKMVSKFPEAKAEDLDAAVRSMFVNMSAELGVKAKSPKKSAKK